MRVIGVIGRKGGVGKTTVAVHLAAEYAARKRRVVVVDADMQGSATKMGTVYHFRSRYNLLDASFRGRSWGHDAATRGVRHVQPGQVAILGERTGASRK